MGKFEKLKNKISENQSNVKWDDLEYLILRSGFKIINKKGSARTYSDGIKLLTLHEPHPQNIVHPKAVKKVLRILFSEEQNDL